MDPVSLILSAMASGLAQGTTESATDAVTDAYLSLKDHLSRRFKGKRAAEIALAEHAEDPQTWQAPLAKALAETGASTDQTVIEAAQRLMALLDPAGTAAGEYNIDLRGAQGVQIGDRNTQLNVFGSQPRVPLRSLCVMFRSQASSSYPHILYDSDGNLSYFSLRSRIRIKGQLHAD